MDNTTDYSTEGHNCCAKKLGYFIGVNRTQTKTNPNDTSSSTSSSIFSSAPAAPSASPPASSTASSSSSGLSTGAKAGIGVGVGLAGVAVLIGVGVFIYVRHSRRSRAARNTADPLRPKYAPVEQAPPGELSSSGVHKDTALAVWSWKLDRGKRQGLDLSLKRWQGREERRGPLQQTVPEFLSSRELARELASVPFVRHRGQPKPCSTSTELYTAQVHDPPVSD
ncbi:hypothetical protein LTR70_010283 [Exophiala xenobiotica]|uniref:Uncharacterized protein n=1 Tax=Lithohypha guttulata TaxID=1690604 RepID=A0ABR0JV61_9EURO|nr:hypothetical protein LTR24_010275 [Lithohypha guttulata]KAK5309441.1 hypothetical protein LTR70_010283 [Exophiala xenobiotica]